MKTFSRIAAVAVCALVACFCVGEHVRAQAPARVDGLRVTLMIFSGRANPVYTITEAAQVAAIMQRIAATAKAPAKTKSPADEGRLGYSGIMIDNVSTTHPEIETVILRGAVLDLQKAGSPTAPVAREIRVDKDAGLQDLFIKLAVEKRVITAGARDMIYEEITRAGAGK